MSDAENIREALLGSPDPSTRNLASPERVIFRGWALSGPGPARFGWWSVSPAGRNTWIGKSFADVSNEVAQ